MNFLVMVALLGALNLEPQKDPTLVGEYYYVGLETFIYSRNGVEQPLEFSYMIGSLALFSNGTFKDYILTEPGKVERNTGRYYVFDNDKIVFVYDKGRVDLYSFYFSFSDRGDEYLSFVISSIRTIGGNIFGYLSELPPDKREMTQKSFAKFVLVKKAA